ncbi:MAG: bifunctional glutamate N-acetyltransferase/amino-acid acetyltransferase ArgJ [Alphaproteobacteria bacterium]
MPPLSPLAPADFPAMPAVAGLRLAGIPAGIKKSGARDLLVAELAEGTTVAGCLTRSATASAPVDWCRAGLAGGRARVLVVNAGNANAFTGVKGHETVERTAIAASRLFACRQGEVFIASTGVIGEPLAAHRITDALPAARQVLAADGWRAAADAIRTTDTFAKAAATQTRIGQTPVTIAGIAKGSGMIAPDMATMLAFVFTDARIPADVLQRAVAHAVDRTFNCITVDSDTSTSDSVLVFATGAGETHAPVAALSDPHLRPFRKALEAVMTDLAQQIVRDGEGASKFVTIRVSGAKSVRSARRVGLAIANSPLVKTAIAGEDANWGRVVRAVGKPGEAADRDRLTIAMGGVTIARDGQRVADYDEAPVARHMKMPEVDIAVDLGVGRGKAVVWTCDLTHGYISINADYRS